MSDSRKRKNKNDPTPQPKVIDKIDKLLELVDAVARVDTKLEAFCKDTTDELNDLRKEIHNGLASHSNIFLRLEALEKSIELIQSKDFQKRLSIIEVTGTNVVRELIAVQTKKIDELSKDIDLAKKEREEANLSRQKILDEFSKWKWRLGVIAPVLTLIITTTIIAVLQHYFGPIF